MVKKVGSGKASGKRTLAEVMDEDIAFKEKQKSKFFKSPTPKPRNPMRPTANDDELPAAGPPYLRSENKENNYIVIDDDEGNLEEEVESNASIIAQGEVNAEMEMELDDPSWHDVVEQEDGYMSPTPSFSGDAQDFSSPLVTKHTPVRKHETDLRDSVDRYFGAEAVSSPPSPAKFKRRRLSDSTPRQPHRTRSLDWPPVRGHATQRSNTLGVPGGRTTSFPEVDLRNSFADDRTSDIDCSDGEVKEKNASASNSPPAETPSPLMPEAQEDISAPVLTDDDDVPSNPEARADELRKHAVITGWRERWALNKEAATLKLKRRETNVTPAGRHTLNHAHTRPRLYPTTAPNSVPPKTNINIKSGRVQSRKSLPLLEPAKQGGAEVIDLDIDANDEPDSEIVFHRARLEYFR